jgi:hypothetical protein
MVDQSILNQSSEQEITDRTNNSGGTLSTALTSMLVNESDDTKKNPSTLKTHHSMKLYGSSMKHFSKWDPENLLWISRPKVN